MKYFFLQKIGLDSLSKKSRTEFILNYILLIEKNEREMEKKKFDYKKEICTY